MPWAFLTALALTFIFSFALGIFTLLINPKSRVNQLWFLTTMGVAVWSGVLLALLWMKPEENLGLMLSRILHTGATMLLIFFFHFVLRFLWKEKEYLLVLIVGYVIAVIFTALFFGTNWILTGAAPKVGFDIWVEVSPWYWAYVLYFLVYVTLPTFLLWQEYRRSDGIKKKQISYILLAVVISYLGGMTNLLPQLVNIYPFGTFVVFLYPLIISYGIFLPTVRIQIR